MTSSSLQRAATQLQKAAQRRSSFTRLLTGTWLNWLPTQTLIPSRPCQGRASQNNDKGRRYVQVRTDGLAGFENIRSLGRGSFGKVHLMRRKESGENAQLLAVKTPIKDEISPLELERFRKEGEILSSLDHKNIVKAFDVSAPGDKQPFIAMEYMENGTLKDFVEKLEDNSTYKAQATGGRKRAGMAAGIASGMAYLESKRMVHRDLAARNI